MRIGIAALLGAIVIFFWQFASHMLLPVGMMGFSQPKAEDAVLQAASAGLPPGSIYLLPSIDPAKMGDKPTMDAWAAKAKANPSLFVVVATPKADPASMGAELGTQFVGNLIAAVLIAWVLAATAWGFGARVIGATAFGVFGWLANIVPLGTWYRFPTDYIVGNLIDQGVGWLLAGVAIAWWLGRR